MVSIVIKHNFPEVQRQLDALEKDIRDKALVRAVNRTIEQAQTRMGREISREYNIKSGDVKARLFIRRASSRQGSFRIEAALEVTSKRGRSANVIRFSAKQTAAGVSVKIRRGAGRQVIRDAFIANKGNGAGGTVFVRKPGTAMASRSAYAGSKHAEQIKAVQTIDIGQMFNAKRINAVVVGLMLEKFPEIFAREVRFYTDRFNSLRAST